jgi:hypothetical protein
MKVSQILDDIEDSKSASKMSLKRLEDELERMLDNTSLTYKEIKKVHRANSSGRIDYSGYSFSSDLREAVLKKLQLKETVE